MQISNNQNDQLTMCITLDETGASQHSPDTLAGKVFLITSRLQKVLSTSNFEKTSLLQKGKKGKTEQPASSETVNPIYMWLVHPKEETGLKEGICNYDQIR